MPELLNHFIDNLPSVVFILIMFFLSWVIKKVFAKKSNLVDLKEILIAYIDKQIIKETTDIKQDIKDLKSETKDLQNQLHIQNSNITELKTTLTHMADTLTEIKEYLFKRNRKKD